MPAEAPRQIDMFTGELVDTRTKLQKKTERACERPQQGTLFSSREIAQFGVKVKPLISISPWTTIKLENEDPRTEQEREHDLQHAAEEKTTPMFIDDGILVQDANERMVEAQQDGIPSDI